MERVPVSSEEFDEKFPDTVVLANEEANSAGDVLIPATNGCSKCHGWPYPPWCYSSQNILCPLLPLWYWEIWLHAPILINYIFNSELFN